MSRLFRRKAVEARRFSGFGRVVVRPPVSSGAWCVIAAALAAALVALFVFGHYTKRVRVPGVTVPSAGVLKVTAPQAGIVTERLVDEGERVQAGQVLFVLSSERVSDAGASQTAILGELEWRRASLGEELARRLRLLDEQAAANARRFSGLQGEAAQLRRELATQAAREASAAEQAATFDALAAQRFVSPLTARQRQDEQLEQTARRQALERSLLAVQRELAAADAERRQIPLRSAQQRAELQRDMSALQQEIAAVAAARRVVVTAPQAGVVTAIVAERGQAVGAQPLATLLPGTGSLEAHLFAPSRAVGFVQPGQAVRVRYAAYPYQKFGQYEGRVVQVSRAALAPSELPAQLAPPLPSEPLYRIIVRLAQPHVLVYGRAQPLTAGMQLEADVLQDRRRLIEWVFEPLIALGRAL